MSKVKGSCKKIDGEILDVPKSQKQSIQKILESMETEVLQLIHRLVDPICIAERIGPTDGKYCALMHSNIVRMKMLGFADTSTAKAVGLSPEMLRSWMLKYPGLEADIAQAEHLTKSLVADKLMRMMHGESMVAFNAIRFFLSTRTEEFKEKSEIEVRQMSKEEVRQAIASMYGVGAKPDYPVIEGDRPSELPLLPEPVEPPPPFPEL